MEEIKKNWFIYTTEEINPTRKMLFEKIEIKAVISQSWVSMDYIKRAVAFSTREQALIYLYQYIKPFTTTDKFSRMNVVELDTTYIDNVNECLFTFKSE